MEISVVIPTYRREEVLLNTVNYLLSLAKKPDEILVIDQTPNHLEKTNNVLQLLENEGKIKWIHLLNPSIPHAMNIGLKNSKNNIILFLDDDVIPGNRLISAHLAAHRGNDINIVAGQVLQPGEEPVHDIINNVFHFCSNRRQFITKIMAGNFSVKQDLALSLGGFDENFMHVAYNFEAEFADRVIVSGEKILFEPDATIQHLRVKKGGTRSYGEHLTTVNPSHSVGAYYYFLRSKVVQYRFLNILKRLILSIKTKHHLRNPWWIPITLVAELLGICWAIFLFIRGPRLIGWDKKS